MVKIGVHLLKLLQN